MKTFDFWNRKLHIHLGLFLLLFLWLFSLSGLLLNHGGWKFASFWEQREQKEFTKRVSSMNQMDSASMISHVMQQLVISGEVSNVKLTAESLAFRVQSPGLGREVHVDFGTDSVKMKEYRLNVCGKIRTLHTFNGVDKRDAMRSANWVTTVVWRFAMDAIAIALILICVSSWIMWYKIRKEYKWGTVIIATGFSVCFYFLFLIRLL